MNKCVTLVLPPDTLWLGLIEQSVSNFVKTAGFSEMLSPKLTGAALEACETLINASAAAGIQNPFKLRLEFRDMALIVEIEYDACVRLNPHEAEDYEVPDSVEDMDKLNPDSLWLHLIKKRMDRVFFMVRDSRRLLRMVKYAREDGSERRDWIMVMRPRLKRELFLHLSDPKAAHPSGVLQGTDGTVLKLKPSETFVVRRLDGMTTLYDIYMAHVEELGLISPNDLAGLYEKLESCNMLDDADGGGARPRWRRILHRLVNPDVSIPHADAFVGRVRSLSRLLLTPVGLLALLALGVSGAIPVWRHFEQFKETVAGIESAFAGTPVILLLLYVLILLHAMLHELGHGVVCKHYGGQIPRLGVMFYLSTFIFYCDTTASLNFPRRKRLLVTMGGPIASFAILGAGLWAAGAMAGSGSLWETVFVVFSLVSLFALVMGFNPFIKLDGYYMLSDIVDISNLRERSFRFLQRRLLGGLGFGEDKDLFATRRERRIFWSYGVLGLILTVGFQALPVLTLVRLLRAESASGGRLLWAAIICIMILIRVASVSLRKLNAMRNRDYTLS